MRNKNLYQKNRRKLRVRKKILANPEKPRLTVFRSNQHIYAQIIDDSKGKTLVAVSPHDLLKSKTKISEVKKMTKSEQAQKLGEILGAKAKKVNITKVCFDRGAYKYHGRIKTLAEAAKNGGLSF